MTREELRERDEAPVSPEAAPRACNACGRQERPDWKGARCEWCVPGWLTAAVPPRCVAKSPLDCDWPKCACAEAAPPRATTPELMTDDDDMTRADDTVTDAEVEALRTLAYADHSARSKGGAGGVLRAVCVCGMPHSGRNSPLCDLLRKVTRHLASLSPSRESGALLDELERLGKAAVRLRHGITNDPEGRTQREHEARAAVDRHLASLERDAARMREDSARLDWLEAQREVYTDWTDYECNHAFEWRATDRTALRDAIDKARVALAPSGEPTTTPNEGDAP